MGIAYVSQTASNRGVDATITWSTGPTVTVTITGNAGYGARAYWRVRGKNPDTTRYINDTDADSGTFEAVDGTTYMFQAVWGDASNGAEFTVVFDRTFRITKTTGASITCKDKNGNTLSNGSTIAKGDTFTVTAGQKVGYNETTFTISGATLVSGNTYKVTGDVTVNATATVQSFTLTLDNDINSTIAVNRTSSPLQGANTGILSIGSPIYYNDSLEIFFEASDGYDLSSCTVNNYEFENGSIHTVIGNTIIASSTTVKIYNLILNPDSGTEITVYRTSSPLQGANNTSWSSEEYAEHKNVIYHGDILEIEFNSDPEYEITYKLVNQENFTSGDTYTVNGPVEVVTIAGLSGLVNVYKDGAFLKYLIYIYDGSNWNQYMPYIYDGTNWYICS